ncbi:MAG: ABC transporter substrate-binding protein [Firmicutes bacterium]|uniref:Peptide/nickel transport system substrate-binding protein n=2 Tax=Melghirimyces thermohalophilus TaxID=1236220 RepID=A0A1G6L1J5_9BACL|nr:ABC transporter substrate-binding protein [Melghirimyces thermohalophilus]MDA8353781.1 ABC transporter substrate-binding protein [Bacillota bacterium]SDC37210.1 peptide/nickel transport system substrate-binding protein [Melghirimyces thermohalophilus]
MNMKKSLLIAVGFVLILSTVLAGCGGKSAGGQGKTLIYGRGADSPQLDPALVTDGESFRVTENVMETLVEYKKKSMEVKPGLAKDWEQSDDGKTWTFHLREGIQFHDGTPFNAEAVVFNFERWMNQEMKPSKKDDFTYYASMFGGFKGDEGHIIESVKAVDEYTVQFQLKESQGPFLQNLAMSPFAIASPKAVKADPAEFAQHPVGTGPFKFKSWKKGDSITIVKNEDYWQEGLPKLDRVIFESIPDNSARFTALQSGDIDVMDGLNPDDAKRVEKNENLQLLKRPPNNVGYLAFNTEKEPFDNKKVRQAINHAVNKKGLIKSFYAGLAEPAKNPIPPSMWGYNEKVEPYEYDLDKAKQLLKEAGYEDGFKATFYAMPEPRPYMPDGKKIAEYIQADLKKIGIEVEIVSPEWQTYLEDTEQGKHEMALLGWTGDNGDPDNFLYVLLDQDNARVPAQNIAFYKNEQLHDILIKAQRETEQSKRAELYKKAQHIIHEDAPWVPLVYSTPSLAAQSYVKGYQPHPKGSDSLAEVDIEK